MRIHSKLLNLLGSIPIFNRGFISGGKCSFFFLKPLYVKKKDILAQFSCNCTFKFKHSCLLKKNDQQIWKIHRWFWRHEFIGYYCHNLAYHFIQFSTFFFFFKYNLLKCFWKNIRQSWEKAYVHLGVFGKETV